MMNAPLVHVLTIRVRMTTSCALARMCTHPHTYSHRRSCIQALFNLSKEFDTVRLSQSSTGPVL